MGEKKRGRPENEGQARHVTRGWMRRSSVDCGSAAGREGGLALANAGAMDLNPNLGPEPESEAAIKALDAWAGVLCVLRFADCMQPAATATGCYCHCYCYCYCYCRCRCRHCVYYTVAQIRCCTSRAELVDGRVSLGLNVEDSIEIISDYQSKMMIPDDHGRQSTGTGLRQAAGKQRVRSFPPSSHHRWSAALARTCQDCPHQPPLPERNSSSSSCCRFPLTTSHCPLALPQLGGTEVARQAGYLVDGRAAHPRPRTPACRSTSRLRSGTYPGPAAAEFSRRAGPSCPFLPFPPSLGTWPGPWTWHLDLPWSREGPTAC